MIIVLKPLSSNSQPPSVEFPWVDLPSLQWLPVTSLRQPLAVSQAWQEHQAPAASSSRVEAAPGAAPHAAPAAPKRKTLLPGSLSVAWWPSGLRWTQRGHIRLPCDK